MAQSVSVNMDPHLHTSALSAQSHSLPSPTSPSSSASSIIVVDDSPQAEEAEEEGEDKEEDDDEGKESELIDITPTTEDSESTETNTPEPEQPKATDTVPHRSSRRQAHPSPPSPPSPSPIQDKMSSSSTTSKAAGSSNASGEKKQEQEQNNDQEQEPGTPIAKDTGDIIFERRNERPLSEDLVPLEDLPHDEPLPILERFDLATEQLRHPLFVAIAKTLLVQGNAWQSALDLVDGIRHFNLANLGGRTPKGSVQGAISTALTLAHQLKRIEPIEKEKLLNITYYRVAPEVLEEVSTSEPRAQSNGTRPRVIHRTVPTRRKPTGAVKRKKKPLSTWGSDSLSSDGSLSSGSSDDEVDHRHKLVKSNNSGGRYLDSSSSKRTRAGSSASSTSSPDQMDTIPNGLKKLPKGYVYDTEINQSTLMHLSINPSQTGEFIEHLRNINEKENNFPDRRGEFGLDLTQEPSMFAVEQQTGYAYPRLRNSGRSRLQKEECEDGFAISDLKHNNTFLGRLFCITDGHGGRACSNFVIATIPGAMQVILGKYKPADISLPSVQETIKRQITEALRLIDKEYLEYKKQQYLLFKAKAIPNDPGSDGTTLIVNIFIDKWIINVNLGDSRSMISSRDITGRWNVDFFSEDHTPSLERLVHTIYANGGEFVTHDDKVIRFDPNLKSDKKHRVSLKEARIRVKDAASNAYGIPYRTKNGQCASVNLGACIGDVLYKLDPVNPVLSCMPDVTFIDITKIQQGYLIMASDGLWDYVKRGGKVQDQNAAVSQFVGDKLDRGWNHQRIVCNLSDREGAMALYSDSIQEYDDFTAILVTFNQEQLKLQQQKRREHDEKQKVVQQQQKLLAQQRQKEIEEIQRLQQQQLLMSVEQETDEQETETDVSSVGADSPPSTVPPNDVAVDQSSVASKDVTSISEE